MNTVAEPRESLVRRGRWLVGLTLGYNALEAVLSVAAGLVSGSIALVGFGFDSFVEFAASVVALWRLDADGDVSRRGSAEVISLRLIGGSLVLLALYVALRAGVAIYQQQAPEASVLGICIAIASLVAMPLLAREKRRIAAALSSSALRGESLQTSICVWLSAILLAGLVLNAEFGWWWADPAAALLMSPLILREGVEMLRDEQEARSPRC